MNKKELVSIAQLITNVYPNATFPKEKLEAWAEMLAPYEYELVRGNLTKHIRRSEFPPTIADLVRNEETPQRSASHRRFKDIKQAETEAEQFLREMGIIK